MDHPARVRVRKRGGERDPDLQHILIRERVRGDQLCERLSTNQLGDQIERVRRRTRLVQRHDRRVRKPRGGERLAACALAVSRDRQGDPLDRYLAVQQLVVRAPHDAEATRSQLLAQAIAAEHQAVCRRRNAAFARGMDEGVERLHRLLRSPSAGPPPARWSRKRRIEREVAGSSGRWSAVILALP
jgi:hypothetical protein